MAAEYVQTETWVLQNVKIFVWKKESSKGKHPVVGEMLPGSRAILLKEGVDDYRIKSPHDKSIGWVSKIQVKRVLYQDTKTFKPCKMKK